jgi:hypothetical protein
MSVVLPVDTPPEPRKQPWLLHILMVNTMNFCSFAQCVPAAPSEGAAIGNELLVAVPNTTSSETVTSRLSLATPPVPPNLSNVSKRLTYSTSPPATGYTQFRGIAR